MPVALDETDAKQIDAALVAGVAEIERLSRLVDQMQARIVQLETKCDDDSIYLETVISSRSRNYTDDASYLGIRGLGHALQRDYDELDELRAHVNSLLQQSQHLPELPEEELHGDLSAAGSLEREVAERLEGLAEPMDGNLQSPGQPDDKSKAETLNLPTIGNAAASLKPLAIAG